MSVCVCVCGCCMHMCKKRVYILRDVYKNVSDGTTLNMKIFMHTVRVHCTYCLSLHRVCVMPLPMPPIPIMRSYSESLPAFLCMHNTYTRAGTYSIYLSMGINEGESVPEKFSDWMKTKGKEKLYIDAFSFIRGKIVSVAHRYDIAVRCTCCCKEGF